MRSDRVDATRIDARLVRTLLAQQFPRVARPARAPRGARRERPSDVPAQGRPERAPAEPAGLRGAGRQGADVASSVNPSAPLPVPTVLGVGRPCPDFPASRNLAPMSPESPGST